MPSIQDLDTTAPMTQGSIMNGINGHANVANGINGHAKAANGAHSFDTIEESIKAIAQGEFVIVLDDTSRENEGDLIMAAQDCTTEKMAFMIRYTSGYICAPITVDRAATLELPQMVVDNRDPLRTAYTVSIDALGPDVTTGISAHNRAHTVRTLADPQATASSFRRPGHVLPLKAREGGVRVRRGHTEAAVELCRLAGKSQAAVICEMILDGEPMPGRTEFDGGRMMRRDDCLEFGKKWGIKVCTIEDLVNYVEAREGKLKAK